MSLGEENKCFEKIEVSSNAKLRERLVDGDPATYWESQGRSGTHWVRLFIKRNLVIK